MSATDVPGQSHTHLSNDGDAVQTDRTSENNDEDADTYFFESDHVALKGNPEYCALLKTFVLLQAQRVQAVKDLDQLYKCQQKALEDPIGFVDKLQHGENLNIPQPQKVAQLPLVDWDKYTSSVDFTSLGIPKHMTRLKKQLVDGSTDGDQKSSFGAVGQPDNMSITLVRGRLKDESKPNTFNKLWSVEEQKKLEDLLIKFPPEEVEAKRWQKIAIALGNRTPQQVASRVQKYFIKLAKAGLPIPGRLPNLTTYSRKSGHRHHKYNKFYYQPSTFLQACEPPVFMSDDDWQDDDMEYEDSRSSVPDSADVSDEDSVTPELQNTEEYKELIRLKMLRQEKLGQQDRMPFKHQGFKCDMCDCEPIVGTRWHCKDCPDEDSLDFCDNCVDSNFENKKHNSSHRMMGVKGNMSGFVDSDYTSFMSAGYNYLDPNYMPAS